ncbi:MAG: hypothetical protein K2N30_02830 [Clostridia bacterium]|nr:hypothetical protein [Clostridia bacterium]
MKKYLIQTVDKEYYPFDKWITCLEMRAFGWQCKGDKTDWYDEYFIDIDWDTGRGSVSQKFKSYTRFVRVKPYSGNVLFNMVEFLMKIQSWIRRKLIILFWAIDFLLFAIGALFLFGNGEFNEYLALGIYVFLFVYAPSLVYAVLGFLIRKIFRLESKLKDALEYNGYAREQDL